MIIDLRDLQLRDEPLEVEATFAERELSVNSQLAVLTGGVKSHMTIRMSGDCARVFGSLEADLSVTCSRCATAFPNHLAKSFSLEYWPDPRSEHDGDEFELRYADLEIGFYRNDRLDLSTVVSEQIVLEVPMKPMCREDCRGLCERCGADLNAGDCGCDRTQVDPRLAALASWRKTKH